MPVPRALSASCGICVMFELDNIAELIAEQPEDLEGLYLHDEDGYKLLHEGNEY
ncbi:PF11823 domain protein [Mogibacterium sp. CM50]|uniref:PF11823 domain protein n=2 Tax=Mogibacterium timidum TaxID=35519 RepID=X8IT55_9FIRM|nr:PF11823 domain protein [Mogibacterium sp. CM50]EUC52364.1 PF11823 domain protein [Mogibacterium timidum ATCC 33093]